MTAEHAHQAGCVNTRRFCTVSGARRQHVGDARPRAAVAVERIRRVAAVRDLPADGVDDRVAVVGHVDARSARGRGRPAGCRCSRPARRGTRPRESARWSCRPRRRTAASAARRSRSGSSCRSGCTRAAASRGTCASPSAMSSEPASTLGHSMIVGIRSSSSAISVSQICSLALPVLGGHRMLVDQQERPGHVDVRADALAVEPLGVRHRRRVARRSRAPDRCAGSRRRAPCRDARPCGRCARPPPVGRKVQVRQLGHGVADALVDGAADLAAHGVGDGDVHVGGGDRRGHRLEAVADAHHDVGLQHLEHRRQLQQPEAGGLGHRGRRLALDDHRDAGVGREPVGLDDVHHRAEAIEQRRRADDELQRAGPGARAPRASPT